MKTGRLLVLWLVVVFCGIMAWAQDENLPADPYERAVVLVNGGRYNEAKPLLDQVLGATPTRKEALYQRGVALIGQGNPDAAWNDFTRTLELDAAYPLGLVGQAMVWTKRANYAEATKVNDKALAIKPDCAEAFYQRGLILGFQKKLDEAIQALTRCLEINPGYAYAHYQIGLAYNEKKRKDLTIVHLEKFAGLAPKASEAEQVRKLLAFLRK